MRRLLNSLLTGVLDAIEMGFTLAFYAAVIAAIALACGAPLVAVGS